MKKYLSIAFLCLVFSGLTFLLFPLEFLRTNELADNPKGCQYYITLQSTLVNYATLTYDQANAEYIKKRLLQSEADLNKSSLSSKIGAKYRNDYDVILQKNGITSVAMLHREQDIIPLARALAPVVDQFYLDERVSCVSPLIDSIKPASRRILQYNVAGLYDQIPDKLSRIQVVVDSGFHLGVFSGLFVNNQTTTLETQFMTGIPLLSALYVIPWYNFANAGGYSGLVPWCAFWSGFVTEKPLRKILDIAGIDVFTVSTKELLAKKGPNYINFLPGAEPIKSTIYNQFARDYSTYLNTQSYGMAYLANHIEYVAPQQVQPFEKVIRKYFSHIKHQNPHKFEQATAMLYKNLLALNNRYDIILEKTFNDVSPEGSIPAGNAKLEGLVGERALINADCKRKNCTLVLNVADSPGWRAYVNLKPARIERANYAFMAVPVAEGKSSVWFIYSPWSQEISYFISIFSLITLLLFTCYLVRKRLN